MKPVVFFLIISCGFVLSALLAHNLVRLSLQKKFLVKNNMPFSGGLAIGLGFIFSCISGLYFIGGLSRQMLGIIIAMTVMLGFGFIDDLKELSVFHKFSAELIAALFLVLSGTMTNIAFLGQTPNIIITFIWVIGITNAINHLDVMDGVAAGISAVAAVAFFVISFLVANVQIQVMSLALGSSIMGFLILNFPPAKIYMGNTGSHFLGFGLAAMAIVISYADLGREVALLSPLLILGFPVFDTVFLIIIRLIQGRSAFKKSDDHLALRFLKLGMSKRKTLLLMLGLCSFFSFSGVLLSRMDNLPGILLIILILAISIFLAKKMGFTHA